MQPNLKFWENANITTSVLLPLNLALQSTDTATRPIYDFPLRGSLTSYWILFYELLSRPQQEFLREYVLLIVPAVSIMMLSLCSMINQQFPNVLSKFHKVKRIVGGFATTLFFILYSGEVVLYARHSSVRPTELILNPYFPMHMWVALVGLAVGLHILGVLHGRAATATALLELAGGYLATLCGVLATSISSTGVAYRLAAMLYLLSSLLACVTLQAIGLSWGISLFHELGVISARYITRLKLGLFFITGCCKRCFCQLNGVITAVFCGIYNFIGTVITRIRSGDRVSRFVKAFIIQPLIPFQRCLHLLISFAIHYSWKYTRKLASITFQKFLSLWAQFVYGLVKTVRTLVNDVIVPISSFMYSEIVLIAQSISDMIVVVLKALWHMWLVVVYDGVIPLCVMLHRNALATLRILYDGFCRLMRAMRRGGNYLLHNVIAPLLHFIVNKAVAVCTAVWECTARLCSVVVYDWAVPLAKAVNRAIVWILKFVSDIGRQILRCIQRFSWFLITNVIKPSAAGCRRLLIAAWGGLVTYIAVPASRIVQKAGLFLWHYLFGILLLCFGSKFCYTSCEAVLWMASTRQGENTGMTGKEYRLLECLGLLLGGYVCLITGALLLVSKCRPFYKQREIIIFLNLCYHHLDFGLLRLMECLISRCRRISASTFRSMTKFISVVWKAGFDVLDFAFTFAVDLTRSLSLMLYTCTVKPLWEFICRGVSGVWNSPYISFAASCATIAVAFLCHLNNINIWIRLLSLYAACENMMSSVVHMLSLQSLFQLDGRQLSQTVNDACLNAITISKLAASGIPMENIWLTAVNQSLWKLSELPSLGWTLYIIHLGGGLTSLTLAADPKVFVRGIMKVIYYPLIFSFVLSIVPSMGIERFISVSFGKVYAIYTLVSAVVLLMEMQRLRSIPNVRTWNAARQETARRQDRTRGTGVSISNTRVNLLPSAPPAPHAISLEYSPRPGSSAATRSRPRIDLRPSAPPAHTEVPFEYLKVQARPRVVFETTECPICFDDLGGVHTSTGESRTDLCLPCGHIYHSDCLFEWLREQPHCPSCRQVVPTCSHGQFISTTNIIQGVFL